MKIRLWMPIFSIICLSLSLPTDQFTRNFGGKDLDRGIGVTLTHDGSYIAVGFTRSSGAGAEDIYVVKCDGKGNLEWEKTYGGKKNDNGWAIHQTDDNGYVIAGFTESFGNGDFDFYLIKTDETGEKQWAKTYGGNKLDRCFSVRQTQDKGYVFAGMTRSFGAGDSDILLIKTDATGKREWSKTIGGKKGRNFGYEIAVCPDGGYILVGDTSVDTAGNLDLLLLKTDHRGNGSSLPVQSP